MKWLDDALDSYSWMELAFFSDEEVMVDDLNYLAPEIDWQWVLDSFTSADFQSDHAVVFTIRHDFPVTGNFIADQMVELFLHLYGEKVSISVLREAKE